MTIANLPLEGSRLTPGDLRHRQVFEKSPNAYLIIERGVIVDCNDAILTMLSARREQILGQRPEILSPATQPDGTCSATKAAAWIQQACTRGTARFEWVHRRMDDTDFWVDVSIVVLSSDDSPTLLVSWRDISDFKRAEETRQASEARLRAITDSAQDAIVMIDDRGAISFWNPAAEKILGYERSEAIGRNLHELLVPERFHAAHKAAFPKFVRTGQGNVIGKTIELVARRKDGPEIAVSLSLSALSLDGAWHAVGILRDITEKKRADEALRESEERHRNLFTRSRDGIVVVDANGKFLEANAAYCDMLGYSPAELKECSERDDITPRKWHSWEREEIWRRRLMRYGYTGVYEKEYIRKDGSVFPVELQSFSVRGTSGTIKYVWGVVRDITSRKRAEQELRESVTALESANVALAELNDVAQAATRAKSEFLANMSHEIRTPMTAILGFADVLLNEEGMHAAPPERVEALQTIQRNGEHLLELINDILDLSKIEAGKFEIRRSACSPVQILNDVHQAMRLRADAKQLPIQLEYIGAIPEIIHTDPLRLRQILMNLLGNAIKFTESGRIRVVTRLVQRANKPVLLQVNIVDTGIGLNSRQMLNLFQPFHQADSSTSRKYGGTGLGLTISQRLAESLGGEIAASSSPGRGSTFSVTVETGDLNGIELIDTLNEKVIPPDSTTVTEVSSSVLNGCRILLAEDGPDNQRLISFLLKKAGACVTLAENGRIALQEALTAQARNEPFAVILMDMQMPVMDGYQATRQLRESGYLAPIVALTAHAMADDRQKCLDAGCNDYATKPVDRQRLISTIAGWIHGASGELRSLVPRQLLGCSHE